MIKRILFSFSNEADDNNEDVDVDMGGGNEAPIIQQKETCIGCVTVEPNCIHYPCGHCVFCMDCFKKWQSKDPKLFDLIQFTDVDLEVDETQEKETTCPMCKEVVEKGFQLFKI